MKKQLLKKYFIIFCIAIIVPVIFSYYINYTYSYDRLIEGAIEDREELLAQAVRSMDQIFLRAEAIAPQILLNDSIRNIMNKQLSSTEAYVYDGDVELAQEYIMSLAINSDFIGEVSLISFKNNLMLNSANFAIQQLEESAYRLANEFDLFYEPSYWDLNGQASKIFGINLGDQFYYTQIVYKDIFEPTGMIIVSLTDSGIISLVEAILSDEEAFIFITDNDGNVIINEDSVPTEFDRQEYKDNFSEPSYVTQNDYLVIKNDQTKFNYKMNIAVPMKSIDVDRKMMNIFLVVYLVNFVIIVLACFLTANNIANKFDKINKELDVSDEDFKFSSNEVERIKSHIAKMKQRIMEEEVDKSNVEKENIKLTNQIIQNRSNIKRNISYSLLYGGESRREEATQRLEDFDVKREGNYIVVLVGFNEYLSTVTHIDESLSINVKESIKNLFQTHMAGVAEVFDIFYSDSKEGEKLIAVLNLLSRHDYINQMGNILEKFYSAIQNDLKVDLEISAGGLESDIAKIRHSYQDAYETQKYQSFMSNSHVIIKGMHKDISEDFSIAELKKSLRSFISTSDMEKIRALLNTLKDTVTETTKFMYYCREALEDIIDFAENYKIDFLDEYADMVDTLNNLESRFTTKNEAIEYILNKIKVIMVNRNKGTLSQNSLIMINVIAYINDNYHKDISLSQIADIFNISYSYLSQLFKKEMGEPFKIYLTKIKIEMSAKLLLQSSSSIESIASQVGYNSLRQFYTMFKKYKGVTPAMYREKNFIL